MVTMFFLNVNGFAFGQVNVVVDVFVVIIIVLYYLVYFGQNSGTKNKERGTQMAISLGERWPFFQTFVQTSDQAPPED